MKAAAASSPTKAAVAAPTPACTSNDGAENISFSSLDDCFKTTSSVREGKLADKEKLAQAMIDLCRPEIETVARNLYFKKSFGSLDEARTKTLELAIKKAEAVVGSNH
jgi:hypothetical protein